MSLAALPSPENKTEEYTSGKYDIKVFSSVQ